MRAILLAAGYGSRISREIKKPKSVLDVGGITIVGHTVDMLIKRGIEVAVVVGYQKEEVEQALKGYPVTYYYNPFFRVTNSMASLWVAREFMRDGEALILGNADVYWEEESLDILLSGNWDACVLGDKARCVEGDYFFHVKDGYIAEYGKDLPFEKRSCEYVGVAKISSDFLPYFKEHLDELIQKEAYDLWWENILYNFSDRYPVRVLDTEGNFWGEVDWIEDYERIHQYVLSKRKE